MGTFTILFLLILAVFCGIIVGFLISFRLASNIINKKEKEKDKFESYSAMYDQWLSLKEEQINLEEYFLKHNYNKVAIYGVARAGCHLINELENSDIQIAFAIDERANLDNPNIQVYSIKDKLPDSDVIVITPSFAFEDIYKELFEKTKCDIVSLDDIIYELI